jgi:Tfp pilus assembly protein PilZ
MENRTITRTPGWGQARIKYGRTEAIAVVLNLSSDGLYIECEKEIEKGTDVEVTLHLPDAMDPVFISKVAWVSKKGAHIPGLNFRVGLKIMKMEHLQEEEFEQILVRFSQHSFERSRLSRIKVVLDEHQEVHGLRPYALFFGGCYLFATGDLPSVGQELQVSFHVPTAAEPVSYRARVVYVIDDSHSRSLGIDPGIGLHFIEEVAGSGKSLVAYLGKHEPVFEVN